MSNKVISSKDVVVSINGIEVRCAGGVIEEGIIGIEEMNETLHEEIRKRIIERFTKVIDDFPYPLQFPEHGKIVLEW
jgi:hypothetical protein